MVRSMLFEALAAILAILLIFILYVMVAGGPSGSEKWAIPGQGAALYIAPDGNDSLYVFVSNGVYAVDREGRLKWNITIPSGENVSNAWYRPVGDGGAVRKEVSPIFASDGDTLYLFTRPNALSGNDRVLDIAPNGSVRWAFDAGPGREDEDVALSASGGRIYLFHGHNETVLGGNGTILYTIRDLSDPAAVDEHGFAYASPGDGQDRPSGSLDAYYPNGTPCWHKDLGALAARQYYKENIRQEFCSLPIYRNATLYVPLQNGITALTTNGSVLWHRELDSGYRLYPLSPFDSDDNIYVQEPDGRMLVLGKDGAAVSERGEDLAGFVSASDGIAYGFKKSYGTASPGIDDLPGLTITAYDLKRGEYAWNYTITPEKRQEVRLNAENIAGIFGPYGSRSFTGYVAEGMNGNSRIAGDCGADILAGRDMVFVSYYSYNFEYPIIPDRSRCTYSSGMQVLDRRGGPVWDKATSSLITTMAARGGNVYYGTSDGGLAATEVKVATGLAIAAAGYLFLRFIVFGAVARAKDRLFVNDNRKRLLKFIGEKPGCTTQDMARALGINAGTIRYHLFVLGLNHRVVDYRDSRKFVRYFTNSNSFCKQEQLVYSLMHRETVRRLLALVLDKPGISGAELTGALGITKSSVSRYVNELSRRGIIESRPGTDGRMVVHSVRAEYRDTVATALKRMEGEGYDGL